jgi:hypothetical protein
MHRRQEIPPAVLRLAVFQDGVVSREQAVGLGFGEYGIDRLLKQGSWRRLSPGMYLTVVIEPTPWLSLAWAGALIGGDQARLGGRAAAHLHGLIPEPPQRLEVLVPAARAVPKVTGPWDFRRERPGARLTTTLGSLPHLTVEDTVLDLMEDPDCDTRSAINWLTMAVQARRTTPQRIARAAEARHFLRNRALLASLLPDVRAGVRSPLELDYLREVERPHDLPVGRRQQSRRSTEVDVWYDEYGLLVELDGRLGHTGLGRFRDMRRDNAATSDGLATLRYGSADVLGIPCEVAREVVHNLMLRGWPGPGQRCDRCRRVA